ncbi:MAG: hypothetical protein KatS3mg114_0802 [Planctomycetaceae bacterium]|nr:MAG: hypothetical protein KatS3mg114_0802 [Planctomycetaceae bacterium]
MAGFHLVCTHAAHHVVRSVCVCAAYEPRPRGAFTHARGVLGGCARTQRSCRLLRLRLGGKFDLLVSTETPAIDQSLGFRLLDQRSGFPQ